MSVQAVVPRLVIMRSGDPTEEEVELSGPVVMGRGDTADIVIHDVLVSRRHCVFRPETQGPVVEDLSSQNGTWVNGELVGRSRLRHGDIVRVGNTRITLRVEEDQRAQTEPSWSDQGQEVELVVRSVGDGALEEFQSETLHLLSQPSASQTVHLAGAGEITRRTRAVTAMYRAGQIVQREQDPDQMLGDVLRLLIEVLGARMAAFVMLEEDGGLSVRSARGLAGRVLRPDDVVVSRTVARRVIEGRVGIVLADPRHDAAIPATQSMLALPGGALMVVPMLVGNRVMGLLQLQSARPDSTMDEDDIGLASTIASLAATALQNRKLAIQREEDIEELRRTNADLEAKKRELQEAQDRLLSAERMAAIGQLAAGLAHDGRNALQAIAALSLLKSRYPFDEELQLYVDLALDGQRMVVEMLEEVLAFVRGTPREDSLSEVDLAAVARSMVYLARMDPDVRGRGPEESAHQLELVIDGEPKVIADAGRLKQVVLNLVKNAAQAISTRPGNIEVRVGQTAAGAFVSVRDDGVGIAEDVQARLFEPLFSTKKERGVGLGLHICRSIAERYGGSMSFDTRVGEGTTFVLTLPQVVET